MPPPTIIHLHWINKVITTSTSTCKLDSHIYNDKAQLIINQDDKGKSTAVANLES